MKRYKYIEIRQTLSDGDYAIYNRKSNDWIASIMWYPEWRRFVFMANENSVWSDDCLLDVIDFIKNHARKHNPEPA